MTAKKGDLNRCISTRKKSVCGLLHICFVLLIGLSFPSSALGQIKYTFEEKIQNWLKEYNVPSVGIGIIENGQIAYIKVFGELKKGVPAPDNTIFNVASMTKPVAAMLALKLVESGQWDLDEPLCHYWVDPDVAHDPLHKKLTTRHVLSHQTGFVNWRWQHQSNKLTFNFEPGTQYQYSGEGFEYLKHALEKKFGKTLVELSDSLLFSPLGMNDTRLYWDENMDESRFAFWHDSQGNMHETATPEERGVSAAGSLITTVEDYCKFGIDIIHGAGLSHDLYNDVISSQVQIHEHYYRGLGWGVVSDLPNGEYALEHGGSDTGVRTYSVLLPVSKRGIVVLTNGDNGVLLFKKVIEEALDLGENIFASQRSSEIPEKIELSTDILKKYAGKYLDTYGRHVTIEAVDGALKLSGNGYPTLIMYPETAEIFFHEDFDVKLEIKKDDSGRAHEIMLISEGKVADTIKKEK